MILSTSTNKLKINNVEKKAKLMDICSLDLPLIQEGRRFAKTTSIRRFTSDDALMQHLNIWKYLGLGMQMGTNIHSYVCVYRLKFVPWCVSVCVCVCVWKYGIVGTKSRH